MSDITQILSQIEKGDGRAAEELLPLVYDELRKLAARKMAQEDPDQTLQATALVHEAYVRLVDVENAQRWDGRRHFFAAAAEAMRRILVESARRKQGPRRGGDFQRQDAGLDQLAQQEASQQVLQVHEVLDALAEEDPAVAALVELRYFGGLSLEETAQTLGISVRTASRHWSYAKIWLHYEISHAEDL